MNPRSSHLTRPLPEHAPSDWGRKPVAALPNPGLRNLLAAVVVATTAMTALPSSTGAVCVPFPCDGCWVQNSGQLNLVVLDREDGTVRLVPNIRFQGASPIIALVVPTPAEPTLSEAPSRIWTDASALTAPIQRSFDNNGYGCGSSYDIAVLEPTDAEGDGDGVVILSEQSVGGFDATIIRSDDPNALVDWLEREGFPVAPGDARRFAPLIADDWVFTAMKSDSSLVMPPDGWNASVDPIEFRWSGDRFEVPFGLLEINRSSWMPMTFFVVDDHRTRLLDFDARYANRLSRSETEAIGRLYPSLSPYLQEGRFLTRLDKNFTDAISLDGRVTIEWAPNDDEFRRGWGFAGIASGWLGLVAWLSGALALLGRWARRRPLQAGRVQS